MVRNCATIFRRLHSTNALMKINWLIGAGVKMRRERSKIPFGPKTLFKSSKIYLLCRETTDQKVRVPSDNNSMFMSGSDFYRDDFIQVNDLSELLCVMITKGSIFSGSVMIKDPP